MSLVSRLVLTGTCIGTITIISYVHYKQQWDRDQLHLGVVRDVERQERRKAENLYILQQQSELAKTMRQDMQLNVNDAG